MSLPLMKEEEADSWEKTFWTISGKKAVKKCNFGLRARSNKITYHHTGNFKVLKSLHMFEFLYTNGETFKEFCCFHVFIQAKGFIKEQRSWVFLGPAGAHDLRQTMCPSGNTKFLVSSVSSWLPHLCNSHTETVPLSFPSHHNTSLFSSLVILLQPQHFSFTFFKKAFSQFM